MKKINIAIDGPAGSGKGITSKLLAKKLNYNFLDSGSMFRAIAYYLNSKNIYVKNVRLEDIKNIKLEFNQNNEIVLNNKILIEEIRTPLIGQLASDFSTIGIIREFLIEKQKEIIKEGGYVAEGRGIGEELMPNSPLKIYLTASLETRAIRRLIDFEKKGIEISLQEVKKQIEQRDFQDMNRFITPLKKLPDAIEIDTTNMSITEQVDKIYELAIKIINS